MKITKFIPKWLFQIGTSFFITAFVCLNIYWYYSYSGIYRYIDSSLGSDLKEFSVLINILIILIIILFLVLLLRSFTKMPSLKLQVQNELKGNDIDIKESKANLRIAGIAILLSGIPFSLFGLWMLIHNLDLGYFRIFDLILILLGIALTFIGIIQLITGNQIIKKRR